MSLREVSTRSGGDGLPEIPHLPSLDSFRGCILGCALGDVVGAWAEARPSAEA